MTTYSTDIHTEELSRKGVNDYICKPFSRTDLLKSIKSSAYALNSVSKEVEAPSILVSAEIRNDMFELSRQISSFEGVKKSTKTRHGKRSTCCRVVCQFCAPPAAATR